MADDDCTGMVLDGQLQFGHASAGQVRGFISRHHAHCGIPTAWRFHSAVFNGGTLMGLAIVGNPVALALSGRCILEVNRLCIYGIERYGVLLEAIGQSLPGELRKHKRSY
ncbi:hypothetical protein ACELLULO517_20520 [Acidisoma cellulosilytica]|uniref:Uncharacterized protein n=1 Tax=Acidisoma cellulosilyticum TaxID=2802395 RepID=A0A963Z537_9PROT|nr:XF1762 family protein [Acidisoma cellulosilyticum]MCB8882641.1 hypothetical protein [Acidisoma cellulosilyticum]